MNSARPPSEFFFCEVIGSADGKLESLANGTRAFLVGPERSLVHGTIGFGQGKHGKTVMVHALTHDARAAVLRGDQRT